MNTLLKVDKILDVTVAKQPMIKKDNVIVKRLSVIFAMYINYFFVILVSVLSNKQIRKNKTKDLVLRETQL